MVAQKTVCTRGGSELGRLFRPFVFIDSSLKFDFFFSRHIFLLVCATCPKLPSNISTMLVLVSGSRKRRQSDTTKIRETEPGALKAKEIIKNYLKKN